MNKVSFNTSATGSSDPISPDVTGNVLFSVISITTSITCQPQIDVTGNGNWQNIGTSMSAVGNQVVSAPRGAKLRFNVSAVTGAAVLSILS